MSYPWCVFFFWYYEVLESPSSFWRFHFLNGRSDCCICVCNVQIKPDQEITFGCVGAQSILKYFQTSLYCVVLPIVNVDRRANMTSRILPGAFFLPQALSPCFRVYQEQKFEVCPACHQSDLALNSRIPASWKT